MSFASPEFLLCLPFVVLVAFALRRRVRFQNRFLLAFNLLFYGWWDWRFLFLMLATIAVDYEVGLRMGSAPSAAARRRWLILSLASNLGALGFFKYANFFLGSLHALLDGLGIRASLPVLDIVLPMGISFYVFQSLSYTIDVYRGEMRPVRRLEDFALFVTFFPQLVAGPIERATHLLPQLQRPKTAAAPQVREGIWLVLYGLFQKLAIADACAPIVQRAHEGYATCGWSTLAAGALGFSCQIYGDFAGYSNIARGCGKLLGVELMANFSAPYLATSVTEFWRRWHVSLSTWFRDYLYIPLGGNRKGAERALLNLMIVMLLGGLWHGAKWTYVVWGGLHGLYLVAHKLLLRGRAEAPSSPPALALGKGILVFLLVTLTWVFFRAGSLAEALGFLRKLLSFGRMDWDPGIPVAAFVYLAALELAARAGTESWPLRLPSPAQAALGAFLGWHILERIGSPQPFLYFRF